MRDGGGTRYTEVGSIAGPSADFVLYQLRRDQTRRTIDSCNPQETVLICASFWITQALTKLDMHTKHIQNVHVFGKSDTIFFPSWPWLKRRGSEFSVVQVPSKMNLFKLQVLSRNEQLNVDGHINVSLYAPGLCHGDSESDMSVIISLKDLVRQTVIVSEAEATGYGGYRTNSHKYPQPLRVYICDLAALQFQNPTNSGRLVLIPVRDGQKYEVLPTGLLDDFIYESVVGEERKPFVGDLGELDPARYVRVDSRVFGGPVLFDTIAYKRFVSADLVLAGLALEQHAEKRGDFLHFKFLKYGTGFFAGEFRDVIEANILEGVLDGIESLFAATGPRRIKAIELPFYQLPTGEKGVQLEDRIQGLAHRYAITITLSQLDALQGPSSSDDDPLVLATTNCGDPHAVFGNEMGYKSVDAAIAENLKGKGAQFCPLLVQQGKIGEMFF